MIYLLEDDSGIRNFVIYALNNSGFEAEGFELPSAFYRAVEEKIPELVLLDIMLPEEDGLTVLKKLRNGALTSRIPVIMLSAKGTEYDKVVGLDSGADDYIAKPFGTMELISRIKAMLRRTAADRGASDELVLGGIKIYPEKHEVTADGERLILTHKEYDLLLMLISNKGKVFPGCIHHCRCACGKGLRDIVVSVAFVSFYGDEEAAGHNLPGVTAD